jgi:hypothetical protein
LWYFFGTQSGESKLIFEKRDFSGTTAQLSFTHAYAQYQNEADKLKISVSTDCGATWTSVWEKSGTALATAPAHGNNTRFWPEITEWVDNTVDLSAYDNAPEVMIAFEGISAYGNNLFIDDINTGVASTASWDCDPVNGCVDPGAGSGQYTSITACNAVCTSTDVTETISSFSVYPNPVKDVLTIEGSYISIEIVDVFGKVVLSCRSQKEIDVSSLSNGVYFANIKNQKEIIVKKITVAK